MREYDERQKEAVQNKQHYEMEKQMKKNEITTMASLAKVHGVFNREPNKRSKREDDADFDPLNIRSPRYVGR